MIATRGRNARRTGNFREGERQHVVRGMRAEVQYDTAMSSAHFAQGEATAMIFYQRSYAFFREEVLKYTLPAEHAGWRCPNDLSYAQTTSGGLLRSGFKPDCLVTWNSILARRVVSGACSQGVGDTKGEVPG